MSLAARLHGISPFGPIFGKELRVTSRRKRNHLLRMLYLGGLTLFLLLVWSGMRHDYGGGVAWRMQRQAQLGQSFFATFGFFCVIFMGLIAPVLTSTAIGSERLAKTLPVLLMTPITSWQIVAGKLFSRLLIALMLIGLSLPVLAVVRLLGGVELWQMIAVVGICTCFALSSAAIGLFYSTLINRAYVVILLSYATLLLMYFFLPMFVAIAMRPGQTNLMQTILIAMASNPVINVGVLVMPDSSIWTRQTTWMWLPGIIVQLSMTALLLISSALIVRRSSRREGQAAVELPTIAVGEDAMSITRARERAVGDNPVLWREVRRPLGKGVWRILTAIGVVLVLLISYACLAAANDLDDNDTQIGYAWIFNALYWLLIAVLSATAIAQEKESDTWTLLLAAPISGRAIVIGKLLGLARRMMWPSILIAVHFALFVIGGVITFTACLLVLWVTFTFNTIWVATGIYLSLRIRKVTTAVVVNLIIPIMLYAAVPIVLLILGELLANTEDWAEWPGLYIPYMYTGPALDSLKANYYESRTMWLPVLGNNLSVAEFVCDTILAGCLHIAVAAGIVWYTIKRFDRMVGRAKQVLLIDNLHRP